MPYSESREASLNNPMPISRKGPTGTVGMSYWVAKMPRCTIICYGAFHLVCRLKKQKESWLFLAVPKEEEEEEEEEEEKT